MTRLLHGLRPTLAGLALVLAAQAQAGLVYQEGTDLSDNPAAATALGTLSVGANKVAGSLGSTTQSTAIDPFTGGIILRVGVDLLDAFNFDLSAGHRIASWSLTITGFSFGGGMGTFNNGSVSGLGSTFGLSADQVFQSSSAITAPGLLSIMLAAPSITPPPLPPCVPSPFSGCPGSVGASTGTMTYELVVNVEPNSVPEPGSLALVGLAALGAVGAAAARRRHRQASA